MPRNITVAYRELEHFFEAPKNGSQKPNGVEGNLLLVLMETLGMNFNLVSLADNESGRAKENGSWTGMIGLVHRGEADIAMTSLALTYDRSEVVDFTVPYLFSDINFVTQLQKMLPRVYTFLYPFDKATWTLLFTLILVLPMFFMALYKSKTHRDFSKECLNMFGNVLGKSVPQKILGCPQVFFIVFWWFGTLVISFSYSSIFFACLSVPPCIIPPKDFYQLAQSVQNGEYKVFSPRVSVLRHLIESSPIPEVKYITSAMRRNDWYLEAKKYQKLWIEDQTAHIYSSTHGEIMHGKAPFLIKHQSEGMILFYCGIGVSKRLPDLRTKLDTLLLRVQQAGLFEKYMQDRSWQLSSGRKSSEKLTNPLTFDELFGVFMILACGWCLSGVVLILEWSCKRRSKITSIQSCMHRT